MLHRSSRAYPKGILMDFVDVPPVSFLPFSAGKLRAALDNDSTSNTIHLALFTSRGIDFYFNVTLLDHSLGSN